MKKYILAVVLLLTGTIALIAGTVALNKNAWTDRINQFIDIQDPETNQLATKETQSNNNSEYLILSKETPVKLLKPSFSYYLEEKIDDKITPLKLKLISSKSNDIIDTEQWLAKNPLSEYIVPNPYQGTSGNLPDWIPVNYQNNILVNAYDDEENIFLIYGENFSDGRYLISVNKQDKTVRYFLDFANFAYAPKEVPQDHEFVKQALLWADEVEGILYVSNSHPTYAESSLGMNSYITAIDTKDQHVIWRSQPLVSNAADFIVKGDSIITGYGFTQEPDFLYLLNKKNGKVYHKTKLKTGPSDLVLKEDKLYVRTYDTDYIFQVKE